MDVHVPRAVTIGLRKRGADVLTAQEDGAGELADPLLLDRAGQLGRMVFSQDVDFLAEATRRQRAGETFATVIFARQQVVPHSRLIDDLELLAEASTHEDAVNHVVYLPFR